MIDSDPLGLGLSAVLPSRRPKTLEQLQDKAAPTLEDPCNAQILALFGVVLVATPTLVANYRDMQEI